MKCFAKIFIAGGVFCLFLFNSKAVSCDLQAVFPFGDGLISQDDRQVLEMQPVTKSSSGSSTLLAARNDTRPPTTTSDFAGFLPLLEMGEEIINEAFRFALATSNNAFTHTKSETDSSIFFLNAQFTIALEDKHDNYQYFIVTKTGEEAKIAFSEVERFKKDNILNLDNQIKIVSFNMLDSAAPKNPVDDLYSVVPKRNIISFVLKDSITSFKAFWFECSGTRCPGIRVIVPDLFTEEVIRDVYRRVLRQWHSRIDTVDLGIFKDQNEAAEGMLDVIGKLPPSVSRWNIF